MLNEKSGYKHNTKMTFMNGRLGIALACLIFLPTIWYVGFKGASYTFGTCAAAMVIFCLWLIDAWRNREMWRELHFDKKRGYIFLLGLLICQSVIAMAMADDFRFRRFGESIVGLLVVCAGAVSFSELLAGTAERAAEKTFFWVTWAMLLMAILGAFGWAPIGPGPSRRALFIFSEPSHFVLIFAPFLLWAVVKSQGVLLRVVLFAVLMALLLLIKNMTFLVLIVLAALVTLRTRLLILVVACLVAIIVLHSNYFVSRLNFSNTSFNLSVLVWLQGWQNASIALKNTYGFGLGFQQLGLHGAQGDAALRIARQIKKSTGVDHGTLNLLDGGTLGAKLSAEFGVLGIALIIVCSWLILRSVFKLRVLARSPDAPAGQVFFYCCVASFVLDLFVRGTGYFGPWVLLSLAGYYGARWGDKSRRGAAVRVLAARNVLK